MHAALTKKENPLLKEEAHFVDMCCHILEIDYQDNTKQIGSEVLVAGRGDPVKTIRATMGFLEKLGAKVEDHRWTSLGPSHTMQNADGLDSHANSLKHLASSNKGLQGATSLAYEMTIRLARLDVLRNLEDFRMTLKRMAMAGQWKVEQKKSWEDSA